MNKKEGYWWVQYKDFEPELIYWDGELGWKWGEDSAYDMEKVQFIYKVEYDWTKERD